MDAETNKYNDSVAIVFGDLFEAIDELSADGVSSRALESVCEAESHFEEMLADIGLFAVRFRYGEGDAFAVYASREDAEAVINSQVHNALDRLTAEHKRYDVTVNSGGGVIVRGNEFPTIVWQPLYT